MRIAARLILLWLAYAQLLRPWRSTGNGHTDNEKTVGKFGKFFPTVSLSSIFWWSAASMPSGQILYQMMFVGKYSCTSHVLQYSSSLSYEHSRSLQSSLCHGVVTVLICSFFVVALLFVYINSKNGGKIIHIFTNRQTFSYLFCIFCQNSFQVSSFFMDSNRFVAISGFLNLMRLSSTEW